MRLRCPLCGSRSILEGWFRMRPVCPRCGLRTDRGETDAFIGGYTINFVTAEVIAALVLAAVVLASWPAVPWRVLMWGGVALMVALPVAFFPFSRTLWLAIDLTFRPPQEEDFSVRPPPGSTPAGDGG
jgi:uncharacterized protein (DUF983 family)